MITNMEICYICYCGDIFMFDEWREPTPEIYRYISKLMSEEKVEIRILPHGCETCQTNFFLGEASPHRISLPSL